jgi:hypothetical protein
MVMDLSVGDVGRLDKLVDAWRPQGKTAILQEFPPRCMVYVPALQSEWALQMLRVAASLRVFMTAYGDVSVANELAGLLFATDHTPPLAPPTNNPDGWAPYQQIFRDLQRECGSDGDIAVLQLPAETQPAHPDAVQRFNDAIPDLRSGSPLLADVLAAIEWRAVLLPLMKEHDLGDMALIDLRGLTPESWREEAGLSMARGIAALRSPPIPIWFIQHAGQRADNWEMPGDRPIFTQYMGDQFSWMFEASEFLDWPNAYVDRCGLLMSPELIQRCRSTRSGKSN